MDHLAGILSQYRIVPVVTLDSPDIAVPVATLLVENGLPLIEITFRTHAAEESIRMIRKSHPHMHIGAGTVLFPDQALAAKKAGADFVVAPGFNPKMVDFCLQNQIPMIPGVDSPSLIEAALDKGVTLVKFYPAEASGGIGYIKAVAAPYRDICLMPTGGITPDNLKSYLANEKVIACGASWMTPSSAVSSGSLSLISQRIQTIKTLIGLQA